MRVNICGIMHSVTEKEDTFELDTTNFGFIDYTETRIVINKKLKEDIKKETLCHEMVHGMLHHLGYAELTQDEQFVQALANAIYQGFDVTEYDDEEE